MDEKWIRIEVVGKIDVERLVSEDPLVLAKALFQLGFSTIDSISAFDIEKEGKWWS